MTDQITQETIQGIVAFIVLFVVIYGPWQRLIVEYARQRLFGIRDSIFDLAADGKMSFDDPAYREIRHRMNMMIRFCHRATWPRMALLSVASRTHRADIVPMYQLVSDNDLRKLIKQKEIEAIAVILSAAFVRSPVLMVLSPLILLLLVLDAFSGNGRNKFGKRAHWLGRNIEQESMLYGH